MTRELGSSGSKKSGKGKGGKGGSYDASKDTDGYRVITPDCPGSCLGIDDEQLAMIHCDLDGDSDMWTKLEQGDMFKLYHNDMGMCISNPPDCFESSIDEPTQGGDPSTLVDCDSAAAALFVTGLDPENPNHVFNSDCWFFGKTAVIFADFGQCNGSDLQWTPQTDTAGRMSPANNEWVFVHVSGEDGQMFQEHMGMSGDMSAEMNMSGDSKGSSGSGKGGSSKGAYGSGSADMSDHPASGDAGSMSKSGSKKGGSKSGSKKGSSSSSKKGGSKSGKKSGSGSADGSYDMPASGSGSVSHDMPASKGGHSKGSADHGSASYDMPASKGGHSKGSKSASGSMDMPAASASMDMPASKGGVSGDFAADDGDVVVVDDVDERVDEDVVEEPEEEETEPEQEEEPEPEEQEDEPEPEEETEEEPEPEEEPEEDADEPAVIVTVSSANYIPSSTGRSSTVFFDINEDENHH